MEFAKLQLGNIACKLILFDCFRLLKEKVLGLGREPIVRHSAERCRAR